MKEKLKIKNWYLFLIGGFFQLFMNEKKILHSLLDSGGKKIEYLLRGEEVKSLLQKDSVMGTIFPGFKVREIEDNWKVECVADQCLQRGYLGVFRLYGTVALERRASDNRRSSQEWNLIFKIFEGDKKLEYNLLSLGIIEKYAGHMCPKLFGIFPSPDVDNQHWVVMEAVRNAYEGKSWSANVFTIAAYNSGRLASQTIGDSKSLPVVEKNTFSTREEFMFLTSWMDSFEWSEVQKQELANKAFPEKMAEGFKKLAENMPAYVEYTRRIPHSLCHGDYHRGNLMVKEWKRSSSLEEVQLNVVSTDWSKLCFRPLGYDLALLFLLLDVAETEKMTEGTLSDLLGLEIFHPISNLQFHFQKKKTKW